MEKFKSFSCELNSVCETSKKMSQEVKNPQKAVNQQKRAGVVTTVTNVFSSNLEDFMQLVAQLNERSKLHGIDHFVNKKYHPLERVLWFTLVIAAFYGVFYIGNNQMERYRANPTVISLERGTFMTP